MSKRRRRLNPLKAMNALVVLFFILTVCAAWLQTKDSRAEHTPAPTPQMTDTVISAVTPVPEVSVIPTPAVTPTATQTVTKAPTPTPTGQKISTLPKTQEKVAYLTFDDGPSDNITPQILKVLKEKNVKATFFVVGNMIKRNPNILKQVHAEGHAIGNHSYSHKYSIVYKDVPSFLEDLEQNNALLAKHLDGYTTKLVRFPGGSNYENRRLFQQAAHGAGYQIYDWNALTGDAEGKTVPQMKKYLKDTVGKKKTVVVLMHDFERGQDTADMLPFVIDYLREQGYKFGVLGKDTLYS